MNKPTISLAYCLDNAPQVEPIENHLSRASYRFSHHYCKKNGMDSPLSQELREQNNPIILFISDNFLRSAQCMNGALELIQKGSASLLPVVIDGRWINGQTGEATITPTHFEKVSDIIQYINYWQDQYLDLRRQKREIKDLDEEKFNAHLRTMRQISSEVGEFLRVLRNLNYLPFETFAANDFEAFFRFTEDPRGWEMLKDASRGKAPFSPAEIRQSSAPLSQEEPAAEPEKLIEIPGLDLLPESPLSEPDEPDEEEALPVEPNSGLEWDFNKPEEEEEELISEEEEEEEEATFAEKEYLDKVIEYLDAGRIEEGISFIEHAIQQFPDSKGLRYQYALLLVQDGSNIPEAINQLEIVLNMDPFNEEANFLMGELSELREQYEEALEYYQKVAEYNDDYPSIFYRMGIVTANHFEEEPERAAKYFKKAIKHDPENADAQYQYALLLSEALDKPQKAIKYFKRTLDLQEHHPFANYDLALLYHQSGEKEKAHKAYLRAIEINPELKTPENDLAFRLDEKEKAKVLEAEEHGTIEALKQNIQRLEELLKAREALPEEKMAKATLPPVPVSTVLITGATSGIGKATAEIFAQNGFRVILTGRREDRLEDLKEHFEEEYNARVHTLLFDVTDYEATKDALAELNEDWKNIDILINNAGKAKGLAPIHEGQLEHWEEMVDTNIKGLLYVTRLIAPQMVARRKGHIINVGSIAGKEAYPNGNVYCATKFAVDGLTRAMRLDLFRHNIRVSQVSPGHVEETEFALVRFDGDSEKAKIYEDFKPVTSKDVAEMIFYIATRPDYVNIQDVVIMGTQQAGANFIDRSGRES